ncbi:MAG: tetratricopeptide repeat protein [Anaerolineae bacterium]
MYLRTPKKYTRAAQKPRVVNMRRVVLRAAAWLLLAGLIFVGLQIYNFRDTFGPPAQQWMNDRVNEAQDSMATAVAPTALPTEDPTTRRTQADEAWRRGAIEQALSYYEAILPALPNDVLVHYQVTLGLIIEGRYADAVDAASRTVTANPYSSSAWAIQAFALLQNGQYGEAIASATQALGLDENNAEAMGYLAEAYYYVGQYDRAFARVEDALALDPNNYNLYRVRGILEQNVNFDFEAARNDYQTAYDLAPNLIYPVFELVTLELFGFSEYENALATLRDIIDLNPQNATALYWMGYIYHRQVGDPNQAADFLARCVEANPQDIPCNYEFGRVQVDQLDYARAATLFTTAVNAGSTSPYHYYWAGYAQILLGNCPAALPYLTTGYEMAREQEIGDLYSLYEEGLYDCQAPGFTFQPTPEETPEATVEGS